MLIRHFQTLQKKKHVEEELEYQRDRLGNYKNACRRTSRADCAASDGHWREDGTINDVSSGGVNPAAASGFQASDEEASHDDLYGATTSERRSAG